MSVSGVAVGFEVVTTMAVIVIMILTAAVACVAALAITHAVAGNGDGAMTADVSCAVLLLLTVAVIEAVTAVVGQQEYTQNKHNTSHRKNHNHIYGTFHSNCQSTSPSRSYSYCNATSTATDT